MATKTICQYETRDPSTQGWVLSRRWATPAFIEMLGETKARIIEGTATEIDDSHLDTNGQTVLDFKP